MLEWAVMRISLYARGAEKVCQIDVRPLSARIPAAGLLTSVSDISDQESNGRIQIAKLVAQRTNE